MNGADLILNDEIILEGHVLEHDWCQWMDGGCFSARMVREALAEFSGDVAVRVNSGGGDPFEGEAIRVALAAHTGQVTAIVGGVAASAASLLIMGAHRIEISEGSFIMIHDPSTRLFGGADDLRQEADRLDTLAATYAQVYASRSGQPSETVAQMMAVETWLGGADAVSRGFADGLAGAESDDSSEALSTAQSMHSLSRQAMQRCLTHFSASGQAPVSKPSAPAAHQQASMAATQEAPMPEENPAVETPTTQPQPAAVTMSAGDTTAAEQRGATMERTRQSSIREMARPFMAAGQLSEAQVDVLINEGTPAETAGNRLMAVMAAAEQPIAPGSDNPARITGDEVDTRMEGMIQAMMRDFSGPGEQFRGMSVRGLAMELGGSRGFNINQQIATGMRATSMMGGAHGVSDFAYITTEVMNRSLIAEYDRRGAGWDVVTGTPLSASDFRELHNVRFGGDFQLKTVKENGEYEEATLKDEAEGLTIERRGRTISLTFEAVVNDDMGAFGRIPREFAMAARMMEASMVWKLIRSNAALKSDGTALFHADHKNLASSGSALSVSSVGAGRKSMWRQTAFGSKDEEDFLNITPNILLVPDALETVALKFTSDITPAKGDDVNPYRRSLTPHVVPNIGAAVTGGSDTAWYLISSDLPPISVANLEGYEAPTVRTIEGMNPDKVTMNARHIFGAAATEHRGVYKNPGQ